MLDRETIVEIVMDFQEQRLPPLIRREVEVPLELKIRRAISIIGPRRAGKTFFMFQLIKDLLERGVDRSRLLYINFEDYRLEGMDCRDFGKIIEVYYEIFPGNKRKRVWFFFDEVQNVEGWEKVVRTVIDRENAQIFVAGSSSKLLSKEVATQLRGRTLTYKMLPFSFREFLKAKGFKVKTHISSHNKARLLNLLDEYLRWGGYPEAVIESARRERILEEIWEVTIARDIMDRWKIRNIKVLRLLIKALKESRELSIHRFHNYLKSVGIKVSKNTLYSYLEYLNDSLVVFPLKKFSYSYKDFEKSIPKIYFIDNGLYTGERQLGRLLENLVFIELVRRGYTVNENLFYWKNHAGKEVDFILWRRNKVEQLIQVCYELTPKNEKREVMSLVKASNELNCRKLLILTWDQEGEITKKGKKVGIVPLWKWLLERPV